MGRSKRLSMIVADSGVEEKMVRLQGPEYKVDEVRKGYQHNLLVLN